MNRKTKITFPCLVNKFVYNEEAGTVFSKVKYVVTDKNDKEDFVSKINGYEYFKANKYTLTRVLSILLIDYLENKNQNFTLKIKNLDIWELLQLNSLKEFEEKKYFNKLMIEKEELEKLKTRTLEFYNRDLNSIKNLMVDPSIKEKSLLEMENNKEFIMYFLFLRELIIPYICKNLFNLPFEYFKILDPIKINLTIPIEEGFVFDSLSKSFVKGISMLRSRRRLKISAFNAKNVGLKLVPAQRNFVDYNSENLNDRYLKDLGVCSPRLVVSCVDKGNDKNLEKDNYLNGLVQSVHHFDLEKMNLNLYFNKISNNNKQKKFKVEIMNKSFYKDLGIFEKTMLSAKLGIHSHLTDELVRKSYSARIFQILNDVNGGLFEVHSSNNNHKIRMRDRNYVYIPGNHLKLYKFEVNKRRKKGEKKSQRVKTQIIVQPRLCSLDWIKTAK